MKGEKPELTGPVYQRKLRLLYQCKANDFSETVAKPRFFHLISVARSAQRCRSAFSAPSTAACNRSPIPQRTLPLCTSARSFCRMGSINSSTPCRFNLLMSMRPRQPPKTSNVQRKMQTIRIRLPHMILVLTLHPESQSNAPPNQVALHCFLTAVTRPRRARRRAGLPKLRKRTIVFCHKASAPCVGRQHKSMSRHLPHRAGAAVP